MLYERQYVVIKNFLPKEIIDMAMDMWRSDEEFGMHTKNRTEI